jgi:hypothetical protein
MERVQLSPAKGITHYENLSNNYREARRGLEAVVENSFMLVSRSHWMSWQELGPPTTECTSRPPLNSTNTRHPSAPTPSLPHRHSYYSSYQYSSGSSFLVKSLGALTLGSHSSHLAVPHDNRTRHISVTARHYPQWLHLTGAVSPVTICPTLSHISPLPYTHSRNCNNNSNSISKTYSTQASVVETRRITSTYSATTRVASSQVRVV